MLKEGMFVQERYEIISRIGAGGMADVYKAKDHKLNRFVAVKVLKSEFREDKAFVSKFRVEAQSAAGLAHPNIVNVYDVGEEGDVNFIVMELVEGITLKAYIEKKGRLAVREATSIAIQISMGLQAAHQNKIVHRDVKPQNIIISTDGKVKVTDFGIARAASSNTISSNVMGSVHYSSPEQARGGYSDSKSDIYSLGITMYEMLTGHVPFDGDTAVAIAIKHLQEEMQSPRKYVADLPKSTVQIIYKCTQKSPDRRYAELDELIRDLKESLVNPEGDFVQIVPLTNHAQTVVLTDQELEQIKQGAVVDPVHKQTEYQDNQPPYAGDHQRDTYGAGYPGEYEKEYYPEEDEYEAGNRKKEKALTVASVIVGIIILLIFLLLVGNAVGLINLGFLTGDRGKQTEAVETENATEAPTTAAETVIVPNLLGMSGDEGTAELNAKGLGGKYGGEVESSEYPAGQIVKQEPAAGEAVAPNTQVVYYVSKGEAGVALPDVIGRTLTEAQQMFKDYNLKIDTEYAYDDSVAEGLIISTNPDAGATVNTGDTITVTISKGAQSGDTDSTSDIITMPDVVGQPLADARATLEGLGLYVNASENNSSEYAAGTIMSQSIDSGLTVSVGTTIDLEVSIGALDEEDTDGNTAGASYTCNVSLKEPPGYNGEKVKITIEQDGVETTLLSEQVVTFPYDVSWTSTSDSIGTAYVYIINSDGSTTPVRYDGVSFIQVN